ncbi:MAG TPA: hypothetical protein VG722_12240 [Tepidisphaeraceae bacterium]|nr:hypothetical protein [Tepidisphaeraceae bacterium]
MLRSLRNMHHCKRRALLAVCVTVLVGGMVRAGTIESFEAYSPGSSVLGQGTWGGTMSANDTATVINTDAAPGQGNNSLEYIDNTQHDTSYLTWGVSDTPFDGSTISWYFKAVSGYTSMYIQPQVDFSGNPSSNNTAYIVGFGDNGYLIEQGDNGASFLNDPEGNRIAYTVGDWYRIDIANHDNSGSDSLDLTITDATTNSLIFNQVGMTGYSVGGRDTLDAVQFVTSSDYGQTSHLDGIALNEVVAPEPTSLGAGLAALGGLLLVSRRRAIDANI